MAAQPESAGIAGARLEAAAGALLEHIDALETREDAGRLVRLAQPAVDRRGS